MINEVREIREAAGLTQSELARRAGVGQPNIAAYEAGRRRPSPDMITRLRNAARPLPHTTLDAHRQALADLAAAYGLRNLRVFGSTARGTDEPGSDLDLLVTRDPGVGLLTLAGFTEAAEDLLGVDVDVVSDGGLTEDHEILSTAVPV